MIISLSPTEREALVEASRRDAGEARAQRRARMVLMAAAGSSVSSIARAVGSSRSRVSMWLRRFVSDRVKGLRDEQRPGRPSVITALERHQVIATACRAPSEFGYQRTLWSHATIRDAVMSAGLVRSIGARTVGRILEEAQIKPHRVKMWCHSKDPQYQEKMSRIVRLYTTPTRGEPVLCVDEKTGMQALSRYRGLIPARPGRAARFEFEYKRNGTRCLFGCFNVATGQVLGRCTTSRKRPDFFSFMDLVAGAYRQRRVHVVLDNLNTHRDTTKGAFVTEWNRRHGNRFVFHYTPTHGSWLNQIELWFGIVSRRILRYGSYRSPDELVAAIEAFMDDWNQREAHPFRWTYEGLPLVA